MEEFISKSDILRFEQLLCMTDDPEQRWIIGNLFDAERRWLTAFRARPSADSGRGLGRQGART